MKCLKCGYENAETSTYCTNCGNKLTEVQTNNKILDETKGTISNNRNNNSSIILYIVIGILVIVIIVLFIFLFKNSSDKSNNNKVSSTTRVNINDYDEKTTEETKRSTTTKSTTTSTTAKKTTTTTTSSTTTKASVNGGTNSSKLFDFEMTVGSKVIKLPAKISDFVDAGFILDEKKDYYLNKNYTTYWLLKNTSGSMLSIDIYNNTDDAIKYSDSTVTGLMLFSNYNKGNDISFAQGITIGSTYEEMIKAFGDNFSKESENETTTSYRYAENSSVPYHKYYEVTINNSTKKIREIIVKAI